MAVSEVHGYYPPAFVQCYVVLYNFSETQIVESNLQPLYLQIFYTPLILIAKLKACVHCPVAKLEPKYSVDPQTLFSYCT